MKVGKVSMSQVAGHPTHRMDAEYWLGPLPFHYRDNGEPCDHSGTGRMADGCPRGCAGAREHYANDGHPECDDDAGQDGGTAP